MKNCQRVIFNAITFYNLYYNWTPNNYWKVVETILPTPRMALEGQQKSLSQINSF